MLYLIISYVILYHIILHCALSYHAVRQGGPAAPEAVQKNGAGRRVHGAVEVVADLVPLDILLLQLVLFSS